MPFGNLISPLSSPESYEVLSDAYGQALYLIIPEGKGIVLGVNDALKRLIPNSKFGKATLFISDGKIVLIDSDFDFPIGQIITIQKQEVCSN